MLSSLRPMASLYYADLNAVSPATARSIASLFDETATPGRRAVRFVDGGIIGRPPVRRSGPDATHTAGNAGVDDTDWARPSIPTSGPHSLSSISGFGSELSSALNCRHIASHVGGASGLKMCFAATAKGFSAIAIQAFVTAHSLGVEKELRSEMAARLPNHLVSAERGVPGVAPKAYRWVREMEEIAETFAVDGGFGGDGDGEPVASMFRGAAAVFQAVADDPVLGAEKTEHRKHGRTLDEFTETLAEGLQAKKRKRTTEN